MATESRRESVLFVVLFLVLFGVLYGTLTYWPVAREWVVEPWTATVAAATVTLLKLFGADVHQSANLIIGAFSMNIIDGCNGVTPLCLLVSGVLAFPATWRARAIGLGVGIPAVLLVNMVRILGLYVMGAHYPEWFDRSHLYVAQAFVILLTAGIWLWWLGRFAGPPRPAADG